MNLGKGGERLSEWTKEGNHTHTHTHTLTTTKWSQHFHGHSYLEKRVHCLQKWEKAIELFALFQNRWSLYSYCMDDGFIVDPRESKESTHCKVLLWNLAGGAQQTDIIHSFTSWNGSLVYPYFIILNDVCPHGHLHFLTSLQLASFCYLSPKNFGLEVFTIDLLSTSNCFNSYWSLVRWIPNSQINNTCTCMPQSVLFGYVGEGGGQFGGFVTWAFWS
jgi:hypothetical protein